MSVTKEEVVDFIKGMTVLELSEFVKELEQTFGVSAAAPVAVAAMPGGAAEAAPVEEQTEFSVVITAVGDKKINVIKEVRAITSLGPQRSQGPGGKGSGNRQGRHSQGRGGSRCQTAYRGRRNRRDQIKTQNLQNIGNRLHALVRPADFRFSTF